MTRPILYTFVLLYRANAHCYEARSLVDTFAVPDAFMVGSIGILAYMLGNVLHEGMGHGGACLLVGAKPLVLSSVHFECSLDSRLVMAGGTLMNLLAGAGFFPLGRLIRDLRVPGELLFRQPQGM